MIHLHSQSDWPRRVGAVLLVATTLIATDLSAARAVPLSIAQQGSIEQSDQPNRHVQRSVRQDLAQHLGLSIPQVRLVAASRQTWSDGCLGIAAPDEICTQALVEGWLIRLMANGDIYDYRTNATGSVFRLANNQPADGSIVPTPILTENLPRPLEEGVLFRLIASGGLLGYQAEITLYEDGCVVSQTQNIQTPSQSRSFRVSRQQVEQFRQLLNQQQFDRFNALDYSSSAGAADGITVMLISGNSVVQYADMVEDGLPSALQQIIQAWRNVVQTQRSQG